MLIWIVRGVAEYEALENSLHLTSLARTNVHLKVYITSLPEDLSISQPSLSRNQQTGVLDESFHSDSLSMKLQTRLVTASVPGIALYAAVRIQSSISEATFPWHGSVFTWSLASQGSLVALAYVILAFSSLSLALCLHMVWVTYGRFARCCKVPRQTEVDSRELSLTSESGDSCPCHTVSSGRPELSDIVLQQAQQSALVVRACGPKSLLNACQQAVCGASAKGHSVSLVIEQSEW